MKNKKMRALFLSVVTGCAVCLVSVQGLAEAAETETEAADTEVAETETEAVEAETEAEAAADEVRLVRDDWSEDVKEAVNDFLDAYGSGSENYDDTSYVVFDFDNTSTIFDVEEQLAVYQLQTMSFAMTPEELPDILRTELGDNDELRGTDYCTNDASYNDWISDITAAYTELYENYGPFSAEGLDEEEQAEIQEDVQWMEFATKMRAMYDLVYDNESAAVAYPWVLYWFTGMTEQEVYDLATASHTYYSSVETSTVEWTSPEEIDSIVGVATYEWTSGVQVTENIRELYAALQANGIDVWICSASASDVIRAGVDVFGLHDYVTGVMAMTNKLEDGVYVNEYDYETGCAWLAEEDGSWTKGSTPTEAQTQGLGKVTAISNVCGTLYGHGPIAGFMDSTGDFNFCTEYETLKLVVCLNRASRKITDGGGLIAELAMYQKDTLGYDLETANAAGDTFYVLQGRDENGMRTLRSSNYTLRYGAEEEKLFRDEDNETQLQYMIDQSMTTEDVINTFAVKTDAEAEGNVLGLKYGFLTEYAGYHTHE